MSDEKKMLTITVPVSLSVNKQMIPPNTPVEIESKEAMSLCARFGGKVVAGNLPADAADQNPIKNSVPVPTLPPLHDDDLDADVPGDDDPAPRPVQATTARPRRR